MATALQESRLERVVKALREAPQRLKVSTDYAYLMKYGELHLFFPKVWEAAINEVLGQIEVEVILHPY